MSADVRQRQNKEGGAKFGNEAHITRIACPLRFANRLISIVVKNSTNLVLYLTLIFIPYLQYFILRLQFILTKFVFP
jgi:hypothetical protein